MKKSMLFALIIGLLAAIPLTIYSADKDAGKTGRFMKLHRHQRQGPDDMAMGLMPMFKLADDLAITNPQLLQLRMLFQKNCNTEKGMLSRKHHFKKLSDPSLTLEDAKKIAAEAGKSTEEKILAHYSMIQQIKKILTPEQMKKLEELKKSHRGSKGFHRGTGHGRPFDIPGFFESPNMPPTDNEEADPTPID